MSIGWCADVQVCTQHSAYVASIRKCFFSMNFHIWIPWILVDSGTRNMLSIYVLWIEFIFIVQLMNWISAIQGNQWKQNAQICMIQKYRNVQLSNSIESQCFKSVASKYRFDYFNGSSVSLKFYGIQLIHQKDCLSNVKTKSGYEIVLRYNYCIFWIPFYRIPHNV